MDILKTIADYNYYDGKKEKGTISASSFSKTPLQLWFSQQDYIEPIEAKLTDGTLGSLVHLGIEKVISEQNNPNIFQEIRYERFFNGINVSGKMDLIDKEEKVIWDFKTGKNYTKKMFEKDGKNSDYAIQLSIYRWLLDNEDYTAKILWLMKDSKTADGEPTFVVSDVPLMSFYEIENYMFDKIESIKEEPLECSIDEKWIRKIKNVPVPLRCRYYCEYRNVCKYNNPSAKNVVSAW